MTAEWDHLPNAPHIDRIIADLRVNPNNWAQAWDRIYSMDRDAAINAASDAASGAASDAAINAVYSAARDAALGAAYSAAWDAAWTAILALIAWDQAGDYLSLPADQVQVLAALGDHKAALILPAAIAFERSKEIA
jgi:hypothetical protein